MKIKRYLKGVFVLTGIIVMSTGTAMAQKGVEDGSKYGHGEDSIRCLRNYSLYKEYARQDAYKDAKPFWQICFAECPLVSKNLYIDGAKMYKTFISAENNPGRLNELVDTLMLIYDQRIEYYPRDKGRVLEYKGVDLLRYKRDDIEAKKEAHRFLNEAIDVNKQRTSEAALTTYITTSISLYQDGEFTPEDVINDYEKISAIFDALIADGNDIQDLINKIDENMVGVGVFDCETLIQFFSPKFEANSQDIDLLTKLTNFLDKLKCTDSDLYYDALTNRHSLEPSANSSKMLAVLNFQREKYETANKYYLEALEKETNDETKSDIYLSLAVSFEKTGDKPQARTYALKAAELKPGSGEPYMFIGNLYTSSINDCSGLNLPKSVYWAAVDKFAKAKQVDPSIAEKADQRITAYKGHYPNKEEAFFLGIKEGDSVTVGCWINEKTTARF